MSWMAGCSVEMGNYGGKSIQNHLTSEGAPHLVAK